jgi:hypothetical protein
MERLQKKSPLNPKSKPIKRSAPSKPKTIVQTIPKPHPYSIPQAIPHVEVIAVADSKIPKHLFSLTEKNLFEALIYPLSADDFFKQYYSEKALVIKGCSAKRFAHIAKT